jgi:hypothetical protein
MAAQVRRHAVHRKLRHGRAWRVDDARMGVTLRRRRADGVKP